jgi:uncharacterized protein (TIGR02231 family)
VQLDSGKNPQRIPLGANALRGTLDYFAIPKKSEYVFLRAQVRNGRTPLLSGNANVFMNGALTSKTSVSQVDPDGKFKIQLGVDDNVRIKRVVTRDDADKSGLFSSSHATKVTVKMTIRNQNGFMIPLELKDHIPYSKDDTVEVKVVDIKPKPADQTNGVLTWRLKPGPRSKTEVVFTYQVKHPKDVIVRGLD